MRDLTEKQWDVLSFIARFIKDELRPPTYREVCYYFDVASTNAVYCHIEALKKKGWLEKRGGIHIEQDARERLGLVFKGE